MKIDLGKYVITSDSRKFILNTKTIIKTGENAGQERLSPFGYYQHLHQLVRALIRMGIDGDGIKTLQQLSDRLEVIARELAEKFNNT